MTVLGIDLGTTYSCVAYINEKGKPEILRNADGESTTPSVVWFDGEEVVVGQEAKEMSLIQPNEVCSFVKRSMGNENFTFDINDIKYGPSDISALILRKLVQDASVALGETITDVVITVPAYFSFKEREATKRAGEIAGLNVLQLVNEPTAAAFAYGINPNSMDEQYILVYDLGGGTFDTTLIRMSNHEMNVICTDGNHQLGGKDFDDRLVEHLIHKFNELTNQQVDISDAFEFSNDLLKKAETAKKTLSSNMSSRTPISYQGERAVIEITRDEFEQLTNDLVNQTLELTQNMMAVAKRRGCNRIDKLILVGGSSKMPMIAKSLKQEFGIEPQIYDPDEAVAKGAACIGSPIINRLPVRNVSSKTFGITVLDGYDSNQVPQLSVTNLVYRNTSLPVEVSEQFGTITKNQKIIVVELVESNHDKPDNEYEESIINLKDVNPLWAGDLFIQPGLPKNFLVDITFRINSNGQLEISAYDPASGNKIYKTIPEVDIDAEKVRKLREIVIT